MIDLFGILLCAAATGLTLLGGASPKHTAVAAVVALVLVFVVRLGLAPLLALRASEGILLSSALYGLLLFGHFVIWVRKPGEEMR
jgi:membrane protein YdbS with pleckstrin-like domain